LREFDQAALHPPTIRLARADVAAAFQAGAQSVVVSKVS